MRKISIKELLYFTWMIVALILYLLFTFISLLFKCSIESLRNFLKRLSSGLCSFFGLQKDQQQEEETEQ